MYEVSDLLPQKPPMSVLRSVMNCDIPNGTLTAEMDVSESCFYFNEFIRGVSSLFGIEYLAQTVGCYISIMYSSKKISDNTTDLLLEVKNFKAFAPYFSEKIFYRSKIIRNEEIGGFLRVQGSILDDRNNVCCEASLKIYRKTA